MPGSRLVVFSASGWCLFQARVSVSNECRRDRDLHSCLAAQNLWGVEVLWRGGLGDHLHTKCCSASGDARELR